MGKTKLFDAYTWRRKLPEPFKSVKRKRTNVYSVHCKTTDKESTLHTPTISAILAYMDVEEGSAAKGAVGRQGGSMIISEYPSYTGKIHLTVFNKDTGKFTAGKFDSAGSTPEPYVLKSDGESGSALFFALIPIAMSDQEFADEYGKLQAYKTRGFPDIEAAAESAAILCDNLYRRIENADNLGDAGIKVDIPISGNVQPFTPSNLTNDTYSPNSVIHGRFEIVKLGKTAAAPKINVKNGDLEGAYALSVRELTEEEKELVPKLPDWYVMPYEVVRVCQHAKETTASIIKMRNFMFRGSSGTGKTEGARAIAALFGLPYVHLTCSANTEISDLLGQYLPDVSIAGNTQTKRQRKAYPTFEDIQMDPVTAYSILTGIYKDGVTEDDVYSKLLEVIHNDTLAEMQENGRQSFKYHNTDLINAIRYGYVCEIQEPTIIANPGVLVGLNSLMDNCESILLPTGERLKRHPDTVIVVTTNNDYSGCRPLNQSVISRMNMVFDIEEPDIDDVVKRVANITKCGDLKMIKRMAKAVKDISERCRELAITDGCCGTRELISWVQSYMICKDALESSRYTVLSSVSSDAESRKDIFSTCLETKFAA